MENKTRKAKQLRFYYKNEQEEKALICIKAVSNFESADILKFLVGLDKFDEWSLDKVAGVEE